MTPHFIANFKLNKNMQMKNCTLNYIKSLWALLVRYKMQFSKNAPPILTISTGIYGWSYKFYIYVDNVIKGYLCYKTIFCYIVALDLQLMNFFYLKKKIMFHSRDIKIFVFLWNQQISKLWRHHKDLWIMEVTLMLIPFESYVLSK